MSVKIFHSFDSCRYFYYNFYNFKSHLLFYAFKNIRLANVKFSLFEIIKLIVWILIIEKKAQKSYIYDAAKYTLRFLSWNNQIYFFPQKFELKKKKHAI